MYPLLSANVGSAGLSGSAEEENHRHVKLIQIQTGNEAFVSRCSLTGQSVSFTLQQHSNMCEICPEDCFKELDCWVKVTIELL